ncbi:hypothetical protein D3C78_1481760 [compost metagenome]
MPKHRHQHFVGQGVERRLPPMPFRQEIVCPRQRQESCLETPIAVFRILGIARRLGRQRLHRGQGVLDPVIEFIDQRLLSIFRLLSLGDVDQHVDGAHQVSISVMQRRGIRRERNAATVRPFCNGLDAAYRPVFLQGHRHRALIVG